MDELKVQARIVKEALRVKGWARKIGNPQQAGTPDLFIKLHAMEAVMVECKMKKLNLSPIQRETMKRIQQAGMPCGWAVYQKEGTVHQLFIGADPDTKIAVAPENCWMIQYTGKTWDIAEIVKAVLYWSDDYRKGVG